MSRRKWFQVLVITVVTAFLLVFSGITSAQGNSGNAFERVKEVQERHTNELMATEGVVGTAVGLNEQENGHVVLVLLERGDVPGIPQQIEGVRVRPLVTGRIEALQKGNKPNGKPGASQPAPDPTARWPRPVPIGVSTGHPAITAGTIGCRVISGGKLYVLSNNHVYANENQAETGDAVIQPGTYDGGSSPADDIATLFDFQEIYFDGRDNTIDAAIAAILVDGSTPRVGNGTPSDGYGIPLKTNTGLTATINMPVKKYGRTTGLTKGKVYAVNATVNVGYSHGTARFINQIVITPGSFSAGGDSGSLIVGDVARRNKTHDRMPVGLLFAGSNAVTIANPIGLVLERFGAEIDGQ
jgi:hypothetical protein